MLGTLISKNMTLQSQLHLPGTGITKDATQSCCGKQVEMDQQTK